MLTLKQWNGLFGRVIYIGNPQIIDEIATANWQKSAEQYDGFRPLSGDALFIQMNHDRWKSQKKRLAPAFSPQVIDSQYFCLTKHLTVMPSRRKPQPLLIPVNWGRTLSLFSKRERKTTQLSTSHRCISCLVLTLLVILLTEQNFVPFLKALTAVFCNCSRWYCRR